MSSYAYAPPFRYWRGYRLITRLFQSVLRDHVAAEVYSKASKQASVASNRVSAEVRRDEEEQAAKRKRQSRPCLIEGGFFKPLVEEVSRPVAAFDRH